MDDHEGTDRPNGLIDLSFLQFAVDQHAIVSVTDAMGIIIHVNDKFCEISGYTRDELLGQNHRILKSNEHSPKFYKALWKTITNGETWHGEIRNKKKGGDRYWVKASIVPRLDEQGRPFQYIGIRTDITDKKLAELSATNYQDARNKIHRFYLDNIDVGAFLIENATIKDVSSYGAEMLGYKQEELVGQSPTFVVSPRSKKNVGRRVKEGNEEPYESDGLRKDGTTFPMLVRGQQLFYEGRNVRLTTLVDLSERKRAEGELRKLSRAVEQSPAAIFISNTDGDIEYANAKFTEYTGYTQEEALGQNPRFLKSGDTSPEVYAKLWKTIIAGDIWSGEIKDRRKDGSTYWANATIAPVKDDEDVVSHYISSHEDITRRKEAELGLHMALEKAEIANRAKSELLANMSHELRTPLNAIIGFSESMMEETFGPIGSDKNREYLGDIHQSGQHLLELINDILDASAIEAGALELQEENVNLIQVVDASVRLVQSRAEAGKVSVTASLDPEVPLIFADRRRIMQVMLNLLSNAVKFTAEGGEVTVSTQLNDDGSLAVTVDDSGVGMDTNELEKALTQFGQVDSGLNRKHEGTGLGLPLTKGLIELHGGTLKIESEKGHGTLITVTFPKERVT